jgi:peptidoglycan/xylan/chitin deacetylase (PgdA/CDA1 family)
MFAALFVLSTSKSIAITFDDGPTVDAARLLDILATSSIKATFFQVGMNMRKYPKSSELIFSKGHELGNHGDNSVRLGSAPSAAVQASLTTVNNQIKQVTGSNPLYFRPPGLDYGNGSLASVCKTLGLSLIGTDVIGTDVFAEDWNQIPVSTIVSKILSSAHDGGIIRLHEKVDDPNRNEQICQVVKILVLQLKSQGYDVMNVSDLFKAKNKTPVPGQRYDSIQ